MWSLLAIISEFKNSYFFLKRTYAKKYRGLRYKSPLKIIEGANSKFIYFEDSFIGSNTLINLAVDSRFILGKGSWLGERVNIEPSKGKTIAIGNHSSVQDNCRLIGEISIGDDVLFAPNVFLSSGSHSFRTKPWRTIRNQDNEADTDPVSMAIDIANDCWLGINSVVMPGISIGRGSIIGANSVVTKDVEPYTIFGGSPAKQIGTRFDFLPPKRLTGNSELSIPYFYSGFEYNETKNQVALVQNEGLIVLQSPLPSKLHLEIQNQSGSVIECEISFNRKIKWHCRLPNGDNQILTLEVSDAKKGNIDSDITIPKFLEKFDLVNIKIVKLKLPVMVNSVLINCIELI